MKTSCRFRKFPVRRFPVKIHVFACMFGAGVPSPRTGLRAGRLQLGCGRLARLNIFALWILAAVAIGTAGDVVFTNNATIASGNLTYEGSNITVQAGTLTIQGEHVINVMTVVSNGAVDAQTNLSLLSLSLTHSARFGLAGASWLRVTNTINVAGTAAIVCHSVNKSGQVNGAWVGEGATIQAKDIVVAPGGAISADSEGYNVTLGPGGASVWNDGSGGNHGGLGSKSGTDGQNLTIYGDATAPIALGSGGGAYNYGLGGGPGGAGGGAIRLIASGTLNLDGEISADGESKNNACYTGAGAGGSIYATVGSLSGSGRFTAYGGFTVSGQSGSGGGGRIAG